MDQHPIPQDVTGFQFKLIGNMTVKQFGFVAAGVILAVITYYSPFKGAFAIVMKILLVPFFGLGGFGIAFLPIEGRPIDVMAGNFSKALLSPNQYVYKKQGRKLSFMSIAPPPPQPAESEKKHVPVKKSGSDEKEKKLQAILQASQGMVRNSLDAKEAAFLKSLTASPAQPTSAPLPVAPVANMNGAVWQTPSPTHPPIQGKIADMDRPTLNMNLSTSGTGFIQAEEVKSKPQIPIDTLIPAPQIIPDKPISEELMKKEDLLEKELEEAKKLEQGKVEDPEILKSAHEKVSGLEKQIQEIHAQKMQLEQELIRLKNQMTGEKPTMTAPTLAQQQNEGLVRNVNPQSSLSAGVPHIPDTPNVLVGLVKDPRGNVLPNILVEVKDTEGNPVRAFKTNPLGQFASATPLSSGIYTIELEDPKRMHKFEVIQVTANNQIMLPIEIISHDAREELRKELFN